MGLRTEAQEPSLAPATTDRVVVSRPQRPGTSLGAKPRQSPFDRSVILQAARKVGWKHGQICEAWPGEPGFVLPDGDE